MEALKRPWRRYGMAASIAAFCCVVFVSGAAFAQISWKRLGTVTTLTNGQLCKNDGTNIICDSTTPTISSGNLGIGTTAPLEFVDIEGASKTIASTDAIVSISSSDNQAQDIGGSILLGRQDGVSSARAFATIAGFKENGTSGNYAGYLALATRPNGGNMAERIRINSTGFVGIGTASPTVRLHLAGTDANGYAATIELQNQNASGANAFIVASDANWNAGANKLLFGLGGAPSSANTKMVIDSSGYVGIGTTAPAATVDVNGLIKVAGTGSEACSASTVGAVRYNAAGNYMEVCSYP